MTTVKRNDVDSLYECVWAVQQREKNIVDLIKRDMSASF